MYHRQTTPYLEYLNKPRNNWKKWNNVKKRGQTTNPNPNPNGAPQQWTQDVCENNQDSTQVQT